MSTDHATMINVERVLQDRPVVDLLWIVASICFLVVFTLLVILVVVYVRSVSVVYRVEKVTCIIL